MISYNEVGRGTYLRTYEFARELIELKHEVTIMAATKKKRSNIKSWQNHGVKIIEFPSALKSYVSSGWDPYGTLSRMIWLKSEDYDIVHGFESRPTVILPALRLKKKGVPLVLDWCDWFGKGGSVEERPNLLLRTLYRPLETYFENSFRSKANSTTVVCNTLYKRAIELGVNQDRIKIIRNGFNMRGWELIPKDVAREYFGFHHNDFIIGYVGALFPKDAVLMANAFERVQNQLPNARLLHLGRSNYWSNLNNPSINITGAVDELTLRKGLATCDICWLPLSDIPANWGRFPLKFSAYLAAGKATIVTEVGDIPNIVKTHQVGLTCLPSTYSLADKTLSLLSNRKMIQFFESAASNLSRDQNQSWQSRAKLLLNIYERCI
jgi:glycosyltransferase involved in cell wall biosynthesis